MEKEVENNMETYVGIIIIRETQMEKEVENKMETVVMRYFIGIRA